VSSLTRLDRADFLDDCWPGLYKRGHHVLTLGPTQRAGKTHLNFQLLEAAPTHDIEPLVFCFKPKDRTVAGWSDQLGYREIQQWPPRKKLFDTSEPPPGYTLWPPHSFNVADDNERIAGIFRKAMMSHYAQGNSILFLDEVYGLCAELKLQEELIAILSRGSGMGCGAWIASQRGAGTQQGSLPGFIWSQPYHYFLAKSSHKQDRQKYADMAGDHDPAFIEATTPALKRFEFLYLNADGQAAIIGP
jgi:hypothetical protein